MSLTSGKKIALYATIERNIDRYKSEFDQIPRERRQILQTLSLFIDSKIRAGEKAELIFICTHNSRRSHISQIWAQTAAAYYGIRNVFAYSGGTEVTAFNPRAVKAMEDAGFRIIEASDGSNPVYDVRFSDDAAAIKAFSKKFDDHVNPKKGFGAVMTCSHADKNCPIVFGAAARISSPYGDPKDFDGTPEEAAQYSGRVHQIGREILYAFSLLNV